jgi:predicted dehydrogenase
MNTLRFAIIGCGSIGPTHAAALRQIEGVELVAVADVLPERAKETARKFSVSRIYSNDAELIADKDIDAVALCTPSGLHAEGAVKALQSGKHVIVEKPMEVSLAACDAMIAAAKKSGKKLSTISQHRFDSASQVVRQYIDEGKLGKIILAEASIKWWRTQQYYDSGDWRGTWKLDGGGALMNQGVHTLDLLVWLAGDVEEVYARTATSAHDRIEVEDIVTATLKFRNGAVGSVTATTAAFDGLPARLDLFGTDGSAIIEGDRLKMLALKSGESFSSEAAASHAISVAKGGTASVKDNAASRESTAEVGSVWGDAHKAQLEDFVEAIRNNRDPLITPESSRKSVATILAIYESARTGKVVKV